ncbi:LuxR C-terminal-related transcriptional regulator [Pseudomonas entomophila]|uniref:HD domain-containing phosphohydrolase n=1 Tax=Pseudomonas entomophila TaxID=312306 RepID=UPI0023D83EFD|nr:HD domain-containing phosphohydrolase [Pseudomonas entomophila]MDF0731467.1 LuxR C-terminal-related transcriptional regulator [Pseudomonas entomophila]
MHEHPVIDCLTLEDAMLALSMVGDLSMGQPLDQSRRTARLARQLAQACAGDGEHLRVADQVALLRWSGCTANAEGFTRLLGDDVSGRQAMLSQTLGPAGQRALRKTSPLARVHCEVAGEVASALGLTVPVEQGLRNVFEHFDGSGRPYGLSHPEIPEVVYQVVLAGDLEILSRAHGVEAALAWIAGQADRRYPATLVAELTRHAEDWLALLQAPSAPVAGLGGEADVQLTLVANVIDLKLSWLAGYSRASADLVRAAANLMGLPMAAQARLGKAALVHGVGRAAVPNRVWNTPGALLDGDRDQIHLVPWWTQRACAQVPGLADVAQLAAHAYERLDGSGYFRGLGAESLQPEQRLLAVALAWEALRAERPWRPAFSAQEAAKVLLGEAANGRLDAQCCEAVIAAARGERQWAGRGGSGLLSERESEVLRLISLGNSNKETARLLGISPSTVRTHVESTFRKLECTTRAAATLKALTLGLL